MELAKAAQACKPKPLPGGRAWLYVRGLCLAYFWIVVGLCLHYAWPECPASVRQLIGGLGFLASMAVIIGPSVTSASKLTARVRYALSAAVVAGYTVLAAALLSSAAPSRTRAHAGLVVACGIVLCGLNGLSAGKPRFQSRSIVGFGVALALLSLAGSLLPDALFQLMASLVIFCAQLPILLDWPARKVAV